MGRDGRRRKKQDMSIVGCMGMAVDKERLAETRGDANQQNEMSTIGHSRGWAGTRGDWLGQEET